MDLGLTLLEAKIYYALALSGPKKVRSISQITRVSRPDVYRTLAKLTKLGLIEKVIANPSKFRAPPLEIGLQILLDSEITKINNAKNQSEIFINKIRQNHHETISNAEPKFIIVPSNEAYLNRLKKAIDNTQNSIDVITTCSRHQFVCHF